jgi:DNA-directed RNA polymerase
MGFLIIQNIKDVKSLRVRTKLDGSMVLLRSTEKLDTINKLKMTSGIAPNFVHGLDAAHLMETLCLCKDSGINDFMAIHDSYGVHAGNVNTLHTILREAFITVHRIPVVETFWVEMAEKYPESFGYFPSISEIKMGDYNLEDVREAEHFFR